MLNFFKKKAEKPWNEVGWVATGSYLYVLLETRTATLLGNGFI